MNLDQEDDEGWTIRRALEHAHHELTDLVGIWAIVSIGRDGYGLDGGDLREFVLLYVATLIAHGGIVIEGARDGVHYWKHATRYGKTPVEIAESVVREWIAQGEPDPPVYESIAFTVPDYLAEPQNLRANTLR